MSLQIDDDDLPALRERREVGAEHRRRAETAVQQDERVPCSVNLVKEDEEQRAGGTGRPVENRGDHLVGAAEPSAKDRRGDGHEQRSPDHQIEEVQPDDGRRERRS